MDIAKEYVEEIREVALSMDVERFRTFIKVWSTKGVIPEQMAYADTKVLEIALRKMVIGLADPPEDKLEEAKAWLLARGYKPEF